MKTLINNESILSCWHESKSKNIERNYRPAKKSTLLYQIISKHFKEKYYYLNFEDERLIQFSAKDFDTLYQAFLELYGTPKTFFFDEIQNVEGWERFVRRMTDAGLKFFILIEWRGRRWHDERGRIA